jgi:hypothetical protein
MSQTDLRAGTSGPKSLCVANCEGDTVTVYAQGSTKVLRTISQGVNFPDAPAFGP